MRKRIFQSATAGWPQTTPLEKEGGILLTGKYDGVRIDTAIGFIAFLIAVVSAYLAWRFGPGKGDSFVYWIIGYPLAILVIVPMIWRYFQRNLSVRIFPDSIEFKGMRFARDVRIEFSVEQHHLARREEAEEHRSGQRQKRTYRDAIEVVMQYGERRVVIAAMKMKDLEMAKSLVIRLQDTCTDFDKAVAKLLQDLQSSAPVRAEGAFGPAPDIR
jgi:hypothetical protein